MAKGRRRLTPEEIAERQAAKDAEPRRPRKTPINLNPPMEEKIAEQKTEVIAEVKTEATTEIKQEVKQVETPEVKTQEINMDDKSLQGNQTYTPFQGNAENREYATPKIDPNLTQDIPEPTIILANPIEQQKLAEQAKQKSEPLLPPNPAMVDPKTTPEEQRQGAEQLTDMLLGGYDKLHGIARWYCKMDEEDLQEAAMDGKIDPNMPTSLEKRDKTGMVTVEGFYQNFNKGVDQVIVVSDEFKEAVRDPLVRVCMKYGWGLSDEQFLAMKFTEDAATKVSMVVGFKKTSNKFFKLFSKQFMDQTAAIREQNELKREEIRLQKLRVEQETRNLEKAKIKSEEEAMIQREGPQNNPPPPAPQAETKNAA